MADWDEADSFRLDRAGSASLSSQLADNLRRAIRNHIFRPGDVLPGIRRLAELCGTSVRVPIQALAELESEGLIKSRARIGSAVARRPAGRLDADGASEDGKRSDRARVVRFLLGFCVDRENGAVVRRLLPNGRRVPSDEVRRISRFPAACVVGAVRCGAPSAAAGVSRLARGAV